MDIPVDFWMKTGFTKAVEYRALSASLSVNPAYLSGQASDVRMTSVSLPVFSQEAASLEMDLASNALENADREAARTHFHNAAQRLSSGSDGPEMCSALVTATLELSKLNFILGKGFTSTIPYLQAGLEAAEHIGDLRSKAMIQLHLGRHYYFSNRREKAIPTFEQGKSEVEALGDEDIQAQAAEFIGLYYHLQGRFKEAATYFENAVESFETAKGTMAVNPSAPIWLGYCAAYLGQFHRAIGHLDYYRRVLIERGDMALAATTRAVLGIVLVELKKYKEAQVHLRGALREAENYHTELGLYFARGGMACYHFAHGRLEECHKYITLALREGTTAGLVRQYASPIFLELGFELYQAGFRIFTGKEIQLEMRRIMKGPNIHLKAVMLRLLAEQRFARGTATAEVKKDLEQSKAYLKQSGAPIQLAKTRFVLVRVYLREKNPTEARRQARKAWKDLAGYGDSFFPDDLRYLLAHDSAAKATHADTGSFLVRFVDIIQDLMPGTAPDRLLVRLVQATNRYFGAERGAIFLFSGTRPKAPPKLHAACHLTETEVFSNRFRSNLDLVFDVYRKNRPKIIQKGSKHRLPYREKAILCLPFRVSGSIRGVLYHDNAYVTDCFNFLDESQLNQLVHTLSSYIEHAWQLTRDFAKLSSERTMPSQQASSVEMVGESEPMRKMIAQIDQVAATDSSVLILGETGVGKELVARRIHQMSNRRDMPLVVVDLTTISEGLVESELFGHEKGAFTGADRRKKGRLELAHQGTLFIDEVGEIPKSIQVKLLRTLQEKTTMRVGGTTSIYTDFRLIAATNRELTKEVAAGRFREDLYYRLNVIPIVVPPLRDRERDIHRLTRYYLKRYAVRCNRTGITLTAKSEKMLSAYHWPGNVRELKNVIERSVLLSTGDRLELSLPSTGVFQSVDPFSDTPTLDEVQRRYIRHVLKKTRGKIGGKDGAAQILGMKRTSLYNRMKRLNIRHGQLGN
jgi:transcriptional regulator with GAF, ATPase, and Fis domain/tetratricopeptide (TPR) repeat protein